jgi:hypothetical protein
MASKRHEARKGSKPMAISLKHTHYNERPPQEVIPTEMAENRMIDQLIKQKIRHDFINDNEYEAIVKNKTKREFEQFIYYDEKRKEKESLQRLERDGVIAINWLSYDGLLSEKELRQQAVDDRIWGYCKAFCGVLIGIGVLFMLL